MPGIVYLFHNQSLPGLIHIGACENIEEEGRLQALNENFIGDGEFYCIHTALCENYATALAQIEEHLNSQEKKVPGKSFYRLSVNDAIELVDVFVEKTDTYEIDSEEIDSEEIDELVDTYYHQGNLIYIDQSIEPEERYKLAIVEYKKAYELGHAEAKNDIADCYNNLGSHFQYMDNETEANYLKAIKYYEFASEYGSDEAKSSISDTYYSLGFLFHISNSEKKLNYKKAIENYERSILFDKDSRSILGIGEIYMEGGHGVKKDLRKAISYFKRIPENRNSFLKLGQAYNELADFSNAFDNYYRWLTDLDIDGFSMWDIYDVIEFFKDNKLDLPTSITKDVGLRLRIEEELYSSISTILNHVFNGRRINHDDPFVISKFSVLNYFKVASCR
jgi:tetratricopeptide (TPR) repeat protein